MKITIKTLAVLLVFLVSTVGAQISNPSNNITVTVVTEDGKPGLQWETQKEVNSSYFLIESSNDDLVYKTIGRVSASGYSVNKRQYELESLNESATSTYYRVTLVSMDGERKNSVAVNSSAVSAESMLSSK